ncbi:hypothetical protein FOMPIDRAFT_1157609 [Fomitopsis schrenkii]|uniref:AAA+ ATPase domain-containing protein n=1 Tax=Fomitopsis schrenkii TaxID=2126942 RepID=S8EJJ8_FOMSC|nr:hypothetical protein FOMPIDRAFT_1157609 [Fomitopsis schrenkii]
MASFPVPHEIYSLVTSFLSISAISDWIKLFVVGGALETCRRFLFSWWDGFLETFWLIATIDAGEDACRWVLYWLSHQHFWDQARVVDIAMSDNFGLENGDDDDDGEEEDSSTSRKLVYHPSLVSPYKLWYKGRYMTISRETRWATIKIKIFSRDREILNKFMEDARQLYKAAEKKGISIYAADTAGYWQFMTARPKRPMSSIILDPGVKERLLNDARNFLACRKWYSDRGIPYRRGYLLYGAPGSGKTSMIHSIAGELGLNVYIVTLSRAGLDDTALTELISNMPRRCIALMEDIDAAFKRGITRDLSAEGHGANKGANDKAKKDNDNEDEDEEGPKPFEEADSRVTLSGLLNALDGIGAQEGRLLFATTNNYKALDPALCRPGRMDLHIEFHLASRYQAESMFKAFFTEEAEESHDADSISSEKTFGASGPELPSPPATPPPSSSSASPQTPTSDREKTEMLATFAAPVQLSKEEVEELAARFADAIPERQFSMASLQGYLMLYMHVPRAAVTNAPAWVDEEKARGAARGGRASDDAATSGVARLG